MFQRDEVNSQALWLLGFALFEVWGMSALGSWRSIGDILSAELARNPEIVYGFVALLSLGLVAFGLTYRHFELVVFPPAALGGLTFIGLLLTTLIVQHLLPSRLLLMASFTLLIIFKLFFLVWFKAFACFDIELVLLNTPGLLMFALFLTSLMYVMPESMRIVMALLAGIGQMVCLISIDRNLPLSSGDGQSCPKAMLIAILFCSFLFCVLFRLLASTANGISNVPVLTTFVNVFYNELGGVLLLLGLAVLGANYLNRHNASSSFGPLPFLIPVLFLTLWAVLYALFPVWRPFDSLRFGLVSLDLLFIVFFLLLGKHLDCSGFQLFVFDEAVFTAAYLIAGPVAVLLQSIGNDHLPDVMVTVLIVSVQSVMVFIFLIGWMALKNGLSGSVETIARFLQGEEKEPETRERLSLHPGEEGETAEQEDESSKPSHNRPEKGDAPGSSQATLRELNARQGTHALSLDGSEDSHENPLAAIEETMFVESRRESAVALLARTYGLSERETSVMALLIKGRSMKRTGEELFLSTGTVNTYVKRIYAKMGIHTRQELIDRFEEAKR